MTTSQISTRKRYSFLVLAILLLLLGGCVLVPRISHNFPDPFSWLVPAILASGYAVRIARAPTDRIPCPTQMVKGKISGNLKGQAGRYGSSQQP